LDALVTEYASGCDRPEGSGFGIGTDTGIGVESGGIVDVAFAVRSGHKTHFTLRGKDAGCGLAEATETKNANG
jgi:hypothetical protein